MSKENLDRSLKGRIRQEMKERIRFWTRKQAPEKEEIDEEEIEQNQYLWTEYIGDRGQLADST